MTRHSWAKSLIFLVFLAGPGSILTPAPVSAATDAPSGLVKAFQDDLVGVMKQARHLGIKGRYQRLLPAVSRTFDLPIMIRIATGPLWQKATDEQHKRLIAAFRRMSVTTLATLFDGYNGEVFSIVGSRDGPQGTRLVHTQIVTARGERHDITYVAKQFNGEWRLIDVIVDNGISELRVRQSEYHLVLQKHGIEGLIRLLNGKADQLIASH